MVDAGVGPECFERGIPVAGWPVDRAYVLGRPGGAGWPSVAMAVSRTGRGGIVLSLVNFKRMEAVGAAPRGQTAPLWLTLLLQSELGRELFLTRPWTLENVIHGQNDVVKPSSELVYI